MEERNPILACELAVKTWSNIRKEELKDCQFRAVRDSGGLCRAREIAKPGRRQGCNPVLPPHTPDGFLQFVNDPLNRMT